LTDPEIVEEGVDEESDKLLICKEYQEIYKNTKEKDNSSLTNIDEKLHKYSIRKKDIKMTTWHGQL
jgi:hypothetical protein